MSNRQMKKDAKSKRRSLQSKSYDGNQRTASRPNWDDTINDLSVHKLTSGDVARRKAGRVPLAGQVRCSTANPRLNSANTKSSRKAEVTKEEILCDMFATKGRLWSVLKQTDKTITVVRNNFQENRKRFRGLPNITRAPGSASSEPCNVRHSCHSEGISSNSEHDLSDDQHQNSEIRLHSRTLNTEHSNNNDCNTEESDAEEEFDIFGENEAKSTVDSETASHCHQKKGPSDEASPESVASASKKSELSGNKQFRILKVDANKAEGDMFADLGSSSDRGRLVASGGDRTRHQVEDLKKLVDALTLELIATNDRYSTLVEEFRQYKDKNERKMSAVEEVVRTLAMRMERLCMSSNSESVELVSDLRAPNPESDNSFDDSNESETDAKPICRREILAQLEELQRQRDLAQAQLQAISNF